MTKTLMQCAVWVLVGVAGSFVFAKQSGPKTYTSPTGAQLKVLVDAASLGGNEVEIAELTLQPNSDSGVHQHGVTETFYVLEGDMEQVINGKPVPLKPGMAASIRSTDKVQHKAGPKGAKILVIWAPGGEIARVASRWKASQ
jgi:quercetin dioxygenase-like cupin family protein